MSQPEVLTNNLMIYGAGLELSGEVLVPKQSTNERADAAGQYYAEHAAAFAGQGAMILCSGGASAIYDGMHDVSTSRAEGTQVAHRLMREWGVPSKIIEVEPFSTTTTENVLNSIDQELLRVEQYSAESPLGVVTHKHHYKRVCRDLGDAGLVAEATIGIHPEASDSAMHELASRAIRSIFFVGIKQGDLVSMRHRNDLINRVFAS